MSRSSYEPHHVLLRDALRTMLFGRAVETVVRPGDVACDLGSGSGILSLYAARAGARRVHAVEVDGMMSEAIEALAAANGYQDRITVWNAHSRDLSLDEQVDVLICDAMGFFGISEEMEAMVDARDRWLRPGGRMVPAIVDLMAAPVSAADVFEWLSIGTHHDYPFDLGPLGALSLNNAYGVHLTPANLAAPKQRVRRFEMATYKDVRTRFEATWRMEAAATVHGLGGWYDALLAKDVVLTSGPEMQRPMGRSRFFPLPRPLEVQPGDTLTFQVHLDAILAFWSVRHERAGETVASEQMNSLAGHPDWPKAQAELAAAEADVAALTFRLLDSEAGARSLNPAEAPDLELPTLRRLVRAAIVQTNGGLFTGV